MDDRHVGSWNSWEKKKKTKINHTNHHQTKTEKFIGINRRYIDAVINKLSLCLTYYTLVTVEQVVIKYKTGLQ